MGGQTIRLMEEFLRNGNKEEIAYHKAHGGEISPLFTGGHNNMVASITTLATPHNGSKRLISLEIQKLLEKSCSL